MPNDRPGDRLPMSKIQKTVLIPETLCRVIDAHLDRAGVSLSRMNTAAILQYLLSRAWAPESFWMHLATDLEKEGVTFGDVLRKLARRFDDDLDDRHTEAHEAGIDQRAYLGDKVLQSKRGAAMVFKQIADADDPIQGLLDWWDKLRPEKEFVAE